MTGQLEYVLVIVAVLLLASVLASVASHRLGIPLLVLFIGLGMLVGSEGLGGIEFNDAFAARTVGTVALILILFSGGLDTSWSAVRGVLAEGISLATFGVVVTALVIGVCAQVVAGLTAMEGFLLGAIVSSTDAAAVFGILRRKGLQLKHRLGLLLEFESGTNDPMAVFLTVAITQLILSPTNSTAAIIPQFFWEMGIGGVVGYALGIAVRWFVNHVWLDFDGLYPAVTLSLAALAYGGASVLGGSGFLAVYVAGITLGSVNFVRRNNLIQFHDGIAWLMQIIMFLTLGLLVYPSALLTVAWESFLIAVLLMFVARPLAVFGALPFSRNLTAGDRLFVSWVGLRGAVPIILATIPLSEGLPHAQLIFNIVFFVVLLSTVVQGTTIQWVAKRVGVLFTEAERMAEP